eukprot:CAMPEP_0194375024 /NCGR_PEP_ID=MMETSP0174-20130528/23479_1 /TAXON_ID=216777 /ORGANISM="Proboscia alata, Strain PI-D3" /LENGTH=722 /DNA_ID=CAMNT_0039154947 /DNA_START=111 /DNA_END=2279 /DNA_ORIENTATION=-
MGTTTTAAAAASTKNIPDTSNSVKQHQQHDYNTNIIQEGGTTITHHETVATPSSSPTQSLRLEENKENNASASPLHCDDKTRKPSNDGPIVASSSSTISTSATIRTKASSMPSPTTIHGSEREEITTTSQQRVVDNDEFCDLSPLKDGHCNIDLLPLSTSVPSVAVECSIFDCNICLESVVEPVVTLCGHLYCWPCLYKWLEPGMTVWERQQLTFPSSPIRINNNDSVQQGEENDNRISYGAQSSAGDTLGSDFDDRRQQRHREGEGEVRNEQSEGYERRVSNNNEGQLEHPHDIDTENRAMMTTQRRSCPVCKHDCSVLALVPIFVRTATKNCVKGKHMRGRRMRSDDITAEGDVSPLLAFPETVPSTALSLSAAADESCYNQVQVHNSSGSVEIERQAANHESVIVMPSRPNPWLGGRGPAHSSYSGNNNNNRNNTAQSRYNHQYQPNTIISTTMTNNNIPLSPNSNTAFHHSFFNGLLGLQQSQAAQHQSQQQQQLRHTPDGISATLGPSSSTLDTSFRSSTFVENAVTSHGSTELRRGQGDSDVPITTVVADISVSTLSLNHNNEPPSSDSIINSVFNNDAAVASSLSTSLPTVTVANTRRGRTSPSNRDGSRNENRSDATNEIIISSTPLQEQRMTSETRQSQASAYSNNNTTNSAHDRNSNNHNAQQGTQSIVTTTTGGSSNNNNTLAIVEDTATEFLSRLLLILGSFVVFCLLMF